MPYNNIPIIVTLSQNKEFLGRHCTLTEDTPNLTVYDFNDRTTSVAIHPGPNYDPSRRYVVSFYEGFHYAGAQLVLGPGGYNDLQHPFSFNDMISSVRFNQDINMPYTITPIPVVAELYEHKDFGGRKLIVVQDLPDLKAWADFGDLVSSVKVFQGPNYVPRSQCRLFVDSHWSGGHIDLDVGEYPDLKVTPHKFGDKASSIRVTRP
jgi:hypothetical protein